MKIPKPISRHNEKLKRMFEVHGLNAMLDLFKHMQLERNPLPDEDSYLIALHGCNIKREYHTTLEMWYQMLSSGNKPTTFLMFEALSSMSEMLQWNLALKTLHDIPRQYDLPFDPYCHTEVMNACSKARKPEEVLKLFEQIKMRGCDESYLVVAYNIAIHSCGWKDNPPEYGYSKACTLFEEYKESGGKPDTRMLNALVHVCAAHRKWKEALKLLQSDWAKVDKFTYNGALDACANTGQWEVCLDILENMRTKDELPNPDVISFTIAMKACGPRGRWETALMLLSQMKTDLVPPNLFTYSTVASVCMKAGKWEKTLEVLEEVPISKRRHDNVLLTLEMRAWAISNTIGCYEKVLEIFTSVTKIECLETDSADWIGIEGAVTSVGDALLYQVALEACAKLGRPKAAFNIIDSMLCNGPRPITRSFNASIIAFSKYISDHSPANVNVAEILPVLEEMQLHGVEPDEDTITAMINALGLIGEPTHALSVFNEYFHPHNGKFQPDIVSYTAIVLALTRRPELCPVETVVELLTEPIKVGILVDGRYLMTALYSLAKLGLQDQVLNIFHIILDSTASTEDFDLRQVHRSSEVLLKDNLVQEKLVDMLIFNPQITQKVVQNVRCWNCAITACRDLKNGRAALSLLFSMRHRLILPDDFCLSDTFHACCLEALQSELNPEARTLLLHDTLDAFGMFHNSDVPGIMRLLESCLNELENDQLMDPEDITALTTKLNRNKDMLYVVG